MSRTSDPDRSPGVAPADATRVRRLSLAALRDELDQLAERRDGAVFEALVGVLRVDTRRGARDLAERALRRETAARRERDRLDGLFAFRAALHARGARCVAGVDEVGVGPLAGPVVAAAVVLPEAIDLPGLDDSKKLTPASRERLAEAIRGQAVAVGIGEVSPDQIDRLNIRRASLEAMRRAVRELRASVAVDHVMVDAHTIPGLDVPQTPLVHGDARDGSIAAASIVAKVHRDALMRDLESIHPGYGFARHMGYGTAEHLDALRRLGASPVHRRSFAPVAAASGP